MKLEISHAWRALRHRNFRLYFWGQGLSVIGTWMTRLATNWLVYRLTHSALLLGVVSFAGQFAAFVLGPLAGAWVERWDRRRLLVWTQAAAAAQSFVLAALAFSHEITIGEVIALAAFQGFITAFDLPARQAFLLQMVGDRSDLSNAIAINSSMNNGARLLGPALGAAVVAAVGEGWCFLIDALSYFAVIGSLLLMRVGAAAPRKRAGTLHQMAEGWQYVRQPGPIRTLLLHFSWISLMGYPGIVLLPVFAGQVLGGGVHTLGWLSAAGGVGALASGAALALRKSIVNLPASMRWAAFILSMATMLFAWSDHLWLSLVLVGFVGFGLTQYASVSNSIIQALVPDGMRARVLSYYTMAFFGAAPIGSLLAGLLAQRLGAPQAVQLTGGFCLVGAVIFQLQLAGIRSAVREAHERLGTPAVARLAA